jgi:hypothetical protein
MYLTGQSGSSMTDIYNVCPANWMEREILMMKFIVTKFQVASIRALLHVTTLWHEYLRTTSRHNTVTRVSAHYFPSQHCDTSIRALLHVTTLWHEYPRTTSRHNTVTRVSAHNFTSQHCDTNTKTTSLFFVLVSCTKMFVRSSLFIK